jgi:hypothetical protein
LIGGKRKGFATKTHAYRAIAKKRINVEIGHIVDLEMQKEYPYSSDRNEVAACVMCKRWPNPIRTGGINWKARATEINTLAEKLRSEDESVL